ncbi:MAG TPA: LptF/LptG family permease, partial [Spirochaetales bacterium]|nr:LptF/LptG family permease [Spirochaetales bacterium]
MKHSYTLFRYNFKSFIEMFFASMIFFILLIQMFDIFANLFKYLQNNVPFSKIMQIALLYLPKCIIYSLPIALLYSVSFTMGNFFANNELIVVMASGISVWKFNLPIIIFTLAIVISSFFFED